MRLLSIDTALEACSVGVLDTDLGGMLAAESIGMTRGHAEALMPMVERVMFKSRLHFTELHRLAVTIGPGSFTGLRVGIAAARGIALSGKLPIVGLTTLAAYAAPLIAADDTIPAVAAIDARHDHVYLQIFGAGGRALGAPRIAPVREAVRAAMNGPARIVGSGAHLVAAAWPKDKAPPLSVDARRAPDISWIARLGAAATPSVSPPKPLYLRAPDAQPQDAASLPRR